MTGIDPYTGVWGGYGINVSACGLSALYLQASAGSVIK
jgi:hypothetical protein